MSCPGRNNGANLAIVVREVKLVVTTRSVGMRDGCVGGSVDDEEITI